MDKTISISLGGFSFIVDDRAYLKLKSYLDEIRHSLQGMEGTDDIIADVETRIAELFKERLGAREVVNENDVEHIVQVMGRPEQFMDEEETETKTKYTHSAYKSTASGERVKKKLYRDPNDKIIAGVLSGLAHYLGIETWITRVLWIVLFFADSVISFTTFTVLGYIILWIVLPKAETASQKYEMYGQAGDFETIKKNASQAASEMKGVAGDASNLLGQIFRAIGKVILILIGIMLICTGIGLIIAAISLLVTTFMGLPTEFFGYVFDYPWQETLSKVFAIILFAVPAILCIIFGARLISRRAKINRVFVFSSLIVWILTAVASGFLGAAVAKNFMHDIEYTDKKSYALSQDTISIHFNEFKSAGKYKYKWFDNDINDFIHFEGNLHKRIDADISIHPGNDSNLTVEILYKSQGSSLDNARQNAETISYEYKVLPNGELEFNDYITLPEGSKLRNQDVEIIIYVPKNITVHTKNVDDVIIYEGENNYEYDSGNNKFYKFTDGKFTCVDCNGADYDRMIHINEHDSAHRIIVSPEGVHIEDGKEKVIINKKKINISNGTDSLNIDISDN
ncbi:MAG: PspC domain-containing protein [Moheibacter sp.]